MSRPRQTRKYLQAIGCLKALRTQGTILPSEHTSIVSQEALYSALNQAGYWWDSDGGEWKKREAHQNERGGYSTERGVYRLRVMCHELDIEAVCKKIAAEHRCIDMSHPYPNDRKGNPEIVRVYFTCLWAV